MDYPESFRPACHLCPDSFFLIRIHTTSSAMHIIDVWGLLPYQGGHKELAMAVTLRRNRAYLYELRGIIHNEEPFCDARSQMCVDCMIMLCMCAFSSATG